MSDWRMDKERCTQLTDLAGRLHGIQLELEEFCTRLGYALETAPAQEKRGADYEAAQNCREEAAALCDDLEDLTDRLDTLTEDTWPDGSAADSLAAENADAAAALRDALQAHRDAGAPSDTLAQLEQAQKLLDSLAAGELSL